MANRERDWGYGDFDDDDGNANGAVGVGAVCICREPSVVVLRRRGIRRSTWLERPGLAEVTHGVDRVSIYSYFEVEVGAVGETRHADGSEGLALLDGLVR